MKKEKGINPFHEIIKMLFFILFDIKFVDGAKIRKATSLAAFLLSQMFSHLCNFTVNTRLQT